MAYISNSDLEAWLGTETYIELTDDIGSGSADPAKADEARLGAEGEANSYLATRFAVPVDVSADAEAAAVLRAFVLDLAAYRLHSRRPPVPADVVRRREEAVTWLGRVAAGIVQLPAGVAPRANPALGIIGLAEGPDREMTREELQQL